MTELNTLAEKRIVLLNEIETLNRDLRERQRLLSAIEIVLAEMAPTPIMVARAAMATIDDDPVSTEPENAVLVMRLSDGTSAISATKMSVAKALASWEKKNKVIEYATVITDTEEAARNIQGALRDYLVSHGREVMPARYDGAVYDEAVGFLGFISSLPEITATRIEPISGLDQQDDWELLSRRDRYTAMVRQFYQLVS